MRNKIWTTISLGKMLSVVKDAVFSDVKLYLLSLADSLIRLTKY